MSKVKMIVTTLIAALAFTALAAASASATTPGWMVGGTNLASGASEALATTAAVDQPGLLKISTVEVECTGNTLNGTAPKIEGTNKGSATSLEFTGCAAKSPCSLAGQNAGGVIGTLPITAEATLEGALAVVATFSPKTGTTFTTIAFTGASCSLSGVQPVTGHAKVLAPTGQDERTLQLINAVVTAASDELKVGGSAAELKGSALLQLASGKTWSFL